MEKVILEEMNARLLSEICEETPIFAKRNGKFVGMIALSPDPCSGVAKWRLMTGGGNHADGNFKMREDCMRTAMAQGYEFFTE